MTMQKVLLEDNKQGLLLVTFRLEDAWYGLDTNRIQEVILVGEITSVHHAPLYVRGIANLRGKIITILDLSLKLGLSPQKVDADTRILIVNWTNEQVGLLVTCVADVVNLNSEQVVLPPSNIRSDLSKFLSGVYYKADEDRLLGVLDLDSVLEITEKERG
jgi:purine-binding chemotaxis protein CheW